jgi:dihydropteroate synthase
MVPLVMGVVNATPDSFSDGGRALDPADAAALASAMVDEGAAVLDVGGESTRPGAAPVSVDEELARVEPVLEAVVPIASASGVRVSIDTRHEAVARRAVELGATLVNDVSASLWPVAADLGVGWVAMHMKGTPATMADAPRYDDVVDEVRSFLVERATTAREAGVEEVWVDPGIGFGKTVDHNLELLARLDVLVAEGFPVLVGTSRKSTTGILTARSDARVHGEDASAPAPIGDRLEASLATATWAMQQGARMVRVHDVRPHVHAAAVIAGSIPAPVPSDSPTPAAV